MYSSAYPIDLSNLTTIRRKGRSRETRECSGGTQIPLKLFAGLRNTFSVLGDISEMRIGVCQYTKMVDNPTLKLGKYS